MLKVERRRPALSAASLKKIWEYAEGNGDALAETYIQACACIGMLDLPKIRKSLGETWPNRERKNYLIAYYINGAAYEYRDFLGRIILEVIKKEALDEKLKGGADAE